MSEFFCPDYCLGINGLGNYRAASTSSRAQPEKPALITRLSKFAIALALLFVMFTGERWVLEHSTVASNELTVATCAADVAFGSGSPPTACTIVGASADKGSYNE